MWGFAALSPLKAQRWGCPWTPNSDSGAAAAPSWEAGSTGLPTSSVPAPGGFS